MIAADAAIDDAAGWSSTVASSAAPMGPASVDPDRRDAAGAEVIVSQVVVVASLANVAQHDPWFASIASTLSPLLPPDTAIMHGRCQNTDCHAHDDDPDNKSRVPRKHVGHRHSSWSTPTGALVASAPSSRDAPCDH